MGKKDLSEVIDVKSSDVSLKPMLVEFEHGALKKEELPKLQCEFVRSKSSSNDIVVLLNSEKLSYQYKGQKLDCNSQLCQRFFVIRNKRTNKVRVASVDQLIVSRYLAEVTKQDLLNSSKITNLSDKEDNLSQLRKAFGSKRSQRNLDMSSKYKINKELTEVNMEETALAVDLDVSILNNKPEGGSGLIPNCDRNAKDACDVYKLEDIFNSSDVLESLNEVAESVIDHCPKEPDLEYSKFFIDALKMVSSVTADKVKCLIYADALLRFMSVEAKKINNKLKMYNICPLSKQIRSIVMNGFTVTTKSGRTRPLYMRDKAICFVMLLLMTAFDYELSQDYVKTLFGNISPKKMMQMAKALGFTVVFGQNKWILKTPLPQIQPPKKNTKKLH